MGFFTKTAAEKRPSYDHPVHLPLEAPIAGAVAATMPELSETQKSTYDDMLHYLRSQEHGLTFSDKEQRYLSREQILRFLRATRWDLAKCQARMLDNLKWRRSYGVEELTAEHVEPEAVTGKQILLGFDNHRRPCLYLYPGRQNTEHSVRQMQHLVWMLERTADLMPAGVETLALLVNYKGATGAKAPPISQGRETLALLQNHYVERLGRALVVELPIFIWGFFKVITPFMDPVTREKLIFNEDLSKHVPPAQLDKEWGGSLEFEYKHDVYWRKLLEMTDAAQDRSRRNWEAAGGGIGVSEAVLKADRPAVAQPSTGLPNGTAPSTSKAQSLSQEQHTAVHEVGHSGEKHTTEKSSYNARNRPDDALSAEQASQVVHDANQSDIVKRSDEPVDAVYVADSPAVVVKNEEATLKGVI